MTRKHTNKRKTIIGILLAFYDAVSIFAAGFLALLIRFDFVFSKINEKYFMAYQSFILYYALISIVIYFLFRLYSFVWRFVSLNELFRISEAVGVCAIIEIALTLLFYKRMPISYYCISIILQYGFAVIIRFLYRFYLNISSSKTAKDAKKVMLIGAGNAGQTILREVNKRPDINEKIVCIIDDNDNKWDRFIEGVEVIGGRHHIKEAAEKYGISKILIAVPSASPDSIREIVEIANTTGCEIKIIPSIARFAEEDIKINAFRNVEVEDLLGRNPVKVDMEGVYAAIKDKTVLVTGGGGSIGSELCRQVASHNPKTLIIFDIYENNAYSIQLELKDRYPNLDLQVLIGSVRDEEKVFSLFETYHPDIIYHAAAHKHVPLMEDSPCEAIKNNVKGTYNVAFAAMKYQCERMVLISTDKAVNPTNIMGASKRLCEMTIQCFNSLIEERKEELLSSFYEKKYELPKKIVTVYTAVRFGNVLGSNGSVIPIFKKQIENGGPVTVTDPNIIRYFMTIPEAVSLVMQSGVYAKGGEIFVLDMGEPVKIDDLARNMIRLSGHTPDKDIKIVYTGLRPGEKMYEERLMAEEGLMKTANEAISIGKPIHFDADNYPCKVKRLIELSYTNTKKIDEKVKELVPTYIPKD